MCPVEFKHHSNLIPISIHLKYICTRSLTEINTVPLSPLSLTPNWKDIYV